MERSPIMSKFEGMQDTPTGKLEYVFVRREDGSCTINFTDKIHGFQMHFDREECAKISETLSAINVVLKPVKVDLDADAGVVETKGGVNG